MRQSAAVAFPASASSRAVKNARIFDTEDTEDTEDAEDNDSIKSAKSLDTKQPCLI
jgi:hypothetical protein